MIFGSPPAHALTHLASSMLVPRWCLVSSEPVRIHLSGNSDLLTIFLLSSVQNHLVPQKVCPPVSPSCLATCFRLVSIHPCQNGKRLIIFSFNIYILELRCFVRVNFDSPLSWRTLLMCSESPCLRVVMVPGMDPVPGGRDLLCCRGQRWETMINS